MRYILLFFLILQFSHSFGQEKQGECTLQYELDRSNLQEKGIVSFSVTNIGNKNIRINKAFWSYRMQLTEIVEISPNEGNKTGYPADVDCFKDCIKETIKLKPGYTYTYPISIKETIQYERLLNNRTYKFKLWFDLIDLVDGKCYAPSFISNEIIYKKGSNMYYSL